MDHGKRTWELVDERCPECKGQGELVFSICSSCGTVFLICAEEGDVFVIEKQSRGERVGWMHGEDGFCKSCGKVRYEDFEPASSTDIEKLGFDDRSYQ